MFASTSIVLATTITLNVSVLVVPPLTVAVSVAVYGVPGAPVYVW